MMATLSETQTGGEAEGKQHMTNPIDLNLDYLPKMPRNKPRIGCVGAGFIMAGCHLPAYRAAGFNPVAIASRNPANARAAAQTHELPLTYDRYQDLLDDDSIPVIDIAVPPDIQIEIVREAARRSHIQAILAQKPLGVDYRQAKEIVQICADADILLGVNQNMRYDQSARACKDLLRRGYLGEPVLATIEMRAIPHWMPWQERQGWVTLRIMSIHHLDIFRFWLGDPTRVYASVRPDPRTSQKFSHKDGVCLYILEYENGARASAWDDVWTGPDEAESDIYIRWRVEGLEGLARGTIGWPKYPAPEPSRLDFTTSRRPGYWFQPRWSEVWFPDAFAGPMAQLLCALEDGEEPEISGEDNLKTMALVDACYLSAEEKRAVEISEIMT